MADELGIATLLLDGDTEPLDLKLKEAKSRVMLFAAQAQAILDSVHFDLDVGKLSAAQVAAASLGGSAAAAPSGGGSGGGGGMPGGGLFGVRGPEQPGSRTNPLTVVIEAAKNTPLGSMAAGIGESNVADTQSGTSSVATAADMNALRQEMSRLADVSSKLSPASRLAQEGNQYGMPWPTSVSTSNSSSSAITAQQTADALRDAADSLAKLRGQMTMAERDRVMATPRVSSTSRSSSVTETTIYDYGAAAGGSGGRGGSGPPVAYGGAPLPEDSGGGARRTDIYYHRDPNAGRTTYIPGRGLRTIGDTGASAFSMANLFRGDQGRGGAFGLPGFGSIGSLAGLGLEHWLLTALGLTASAGSAVAGAGLLGTAGLTTAVVGGGSDALVNHAALENAKAAVPVYQALAAAVAEYGPDSKQAANAQLLWDAEIVKVGPSVAKLAKDYANLVTQFQTSSRGAQQQGASVMDQIVGLGSSYVPLVTAAAQKNLGIINTGLKPLFSWLEGPQGMGIFEDLENTFSQHLPTSIHAFDMAIEDFLRLMQSASQYTGGLTKALDTWFTDKNRESAAQYDAEVQKLVGDFKEWEALLKVLAEDLGGLFKADAGTANSIVGELTAMLTKLHDWEESTAGQDQLKTIFTVHKEQIDEILNLLPHLISGYGSFYLTVAPALVTAFTNILKAIDPVLVAIEKIPGGADAIGGALVLAKLGLLKGAVSGLAGAFGLLAHNEEAAAGASAGVAGGGGAVAGEAEAAEGAGGVGLAAAGKTGLTAGALGLAGGLVAQSALGLQKNTLESLGGGLAGGGIGFAIGGPLGAAIGSGIGSTLTPEALHLLGNLFGTNSGKTYGQQFADQWVKQFNGIAAPSTTNAMRQAVQKAADAYNNAAHPSTVEPNRGGITGTPVNPSQVSEQARNLGTVTAQQFVKGMSDVPYSSTGGLEGLFGKQIKDLQSHGGPQAEAAAAKVMANYAQGLVENGKLPKNAVDKILSSLEGEFPAMDKYLSKWSVNTGALVASAFDTKQAQTTLEKSLSDIRDQFADGAQKISKTVSADNLWSNLAQAMSVLKNTMQTGTGEAKEAATENIAGLKTQAGSLLAAMLTETNTHFGNLKTAFNKGSFSAVSVAAQNFEEFQGTVEGAMQAGVIQSSQGSQLIAKALNAYLKDFGANVVPIPGTVTWEAATVPGGGNTARLTPAGAASGALYQIGAPGEAGRDSVPLNVGGTPVMVAPGEQVAVFNRHQLPIVDGALQMAGYGGLPGLFSAVDTPNYMAGGGLLGHVNVPGHGTVTNMTRAGLGKVLQAAVGLAAKMGGGPGGGSGGGGVSASGLSGSLRQIVNQIAKRMGWGSGQVADWLDVINRESGGSMTAQNPHSGAYGIAQFINGPGEYAEYGGNVNTLAGQLTAMANYIKQRYGTPSGAWGSELSRGWYASGGMLDAAEVKAQLKDYTGLQSAIRTINRLIGSGGSGGAAGNLMNQLGFYQQAIQISDPLYGQSADAYIVSTDAVGNSIAPYINTQAVGQTRGEYAHELNAFLNPSIKDVTAAKTDVTKLLPKLRSAVSKRRQLLAKIRKQINDNIQKIKALQKQIAAYQKKITTDRSNIQYWGNQVSYLQQNITNEQTNKKPNKAKIAAWQKQIASYQSKITGAKGDITSSQAAIKPLNDQIGALESANRALGGDPTDVGSGGVLGTVSSEAQSLQGTISTMGGYGQSVFEANSSSSVSGTDQLDKLQLQAEISSISPAAINAALATAQNSYAGSGAGASSSTDTAALQQAQTLFADAAFIMNQQSSVFANLGNLPAFGGSFRDGGIVPGAWGEPKMILAHGGEVVTNPAVAGSEPHILVHVVPHGGAEKFVDTRIEHVTRGQAKRAARPRAGQRAGMLTLGPR